MIDKNRFNPYGSGQNPSWLRNFIFALCVVSLVVGWRWIVYAKQASYQKLANELVLVTKIVNHPVPNHAGTQLLYAQSSEKGVAIYLKEIATGKKQMLYELAESRITASSTFSMLAWSPDDKHCAYAKPIKGKKQKVVLCNAKDGKTNASPTILGYIEEFCWLSPESFAYLNNSNHVYVVTKSPKGRWVKSHALTNSNGSAIADLSAISATSLAWRQNDSIWHWSLLTNAPVEIWRPATNQLLSCRFSRDNGTFIINARNSDQSYQFAVFDPVRLTFKVLNEVRLPEVSDLNWINSGNGYAFQSMDHWGDTLYVSSDGAKEFSKIFPEGDIMEFKSSGESLFIFGNEGIEPPGIWKHSLRSRETRSVVASRDKAFSFLKAIHHSALLLTNGSREVPYQIWRPQNLVPGKKYPMILTQTPSRWSPYPLLAASCDYYFVKVNRKDWANGLEFWESDVLAAYQEVIQDAKIDKSRVYLFGHSAESYPVSNLASERADLWKGIFVQSPVSLPDLSRCHFSTILIDAGEKNVTVMKPLPAFQDEAAKRGIAARIIVHPNSGHTAWSRVTEQNRLEGMATFLRQH